MTIGYMCLLICMLLPIFGPEYQNMDMVILSMIMNRQEIIYHRYREKQRMPTMLSRTVMRHFLPLQLP